MAQTTETAPEPAAPPAAPKAHRAAAAASPPAPLAEGAMPYLGTLAARMLKAKRREGIAAIPVVVQAGEDRRTLGVAVVSGPEYLGGRLDAHLSAAGYAGPFVQSRPSALAAPLQEAAAIAIAFQADKDLDWSGALGSFGWSKDKAVAASAARSKAKAAGRAA